MLNILRDLGGNINIFMVINEQVSTVMYPVKEVSFVFVANINMYSLITFKRGKHAPSKTPEKKS